MNKHSHDNFKTNWPLSLIHQALAAIKIEVPNAEAGK